MNSKQTRIERIRANLEENERYYAEGKRTREVYLRCKKDGKRALSELRNWKG